MRSQSHPYLMLALKLFFGALILVAILAVLQMDEIRLYENPAIGNFSFQGFPIGKRFKIDGALAAAALLLLVFGFWKIVLPWVSFGLGFSTSKPNTMRARRYFLAGLGAVLLGTVLYAGFNYRTTRFERSRMTMPDAITAMAYNADGSKIIVGSANGNAYVRNADGNGKQLNLDKANAHPSFRAVAYSPLGDLMAVAGSDNTIRFWSADGSEFRRQIADHRAPVSQLAFGDYRGVAVLAAGYQDGYLDVWFLSRDAGEINKPWLYKVHDAPVTALAFDPTNQYLATGGQDHEIRLLDVLNRTPLQNLEGHPQPIVALSFMDLGHGQVRLASLSQQGKLASWNLNLQKTNMMIPLKPPDEKLLTQQEHIHEMHITAAAFNPLMQVFVTAHDDGKVYVRRYDDGCRYAELPVASAVTQVVFDKYGQYVYTGEQNGAIEVWSLNRASGSDRSIPCQPLQAPGKQVYKVQVKNPMFHVDAAKHPGAPSNQIANIAVNPNTELPALAVVDSAQSLYICSDLAPGFTDTCTVEDGAQEAISQAAFVDNDHAVTVSRDGYMQYWNLGDQATPGKGHIWKSSGIGALAIDTKNNQAALGNEDGDIRLWHWQDSATQTLPRQHHAALSALAFNSNGKIMASADREGRLLLWSGKEYSTQTALTLDPKNAPDKPAHDESITALAFSPDGKYVASASIDAGNNVRVWETKTGAMVRAFSVPHVDWKRLLFAPDSPSIAGTGKDKLQYVFVGAGDDEYLYVFDAESDSPPQRVESKSRAVMAMAVDSQDQIVTASPDGNDVQTWTSINLDTRTDPGYSNQYEEWIMRDPAVRVLLALLIPGALVAGALWMFFQYTSDGIAKFHFKGVPGINPGRAKQHVIDVREGKPQLMQAVRDGQVKLIGSPPPFPGGPGYLTVHEGYAAVLEQNGRISRVVSSGMYALEQGELAEMAIPLFTRTVTVKVENVLTRDQVRFENIKLLILHRVQCVNDTHADDNKTSSPDRLPKDDKNAAPKTDAESDAKKERFSLDKEVIGSKIWNPEHAPYDQWLEPFLQSKVRELVGQEYFEDIYTGSGGVRQRLSNGLRERLTNAASQRGMVIEKLDVTEIELEEKLAKAIQERKLAELKRQVDITKAQTKRDALLIKQDARAELRDALLRQIADPLRDKNRGVILDAEIAVRYIEAIERLSMTFIREEIGVEPEGTVEGKVVVGEIVPATDTTKTESAPAFSAGFSASASAATKGGASSSAAAAAGGA